MLKKIIIFLIFICCFNISNANYKLENASKLLVWKYNISTKNLDKQISRKEFVEILYKWYIDYKKNKWTIINYNDFKKIDNSKIFIDIDLDSEFWKKLNFFASLGAFAKNKYFNPNDKMTQKTFFIVMNKLWIIYSLQNCKYHKICERESDNKTLFLKWTYLKYVSKIMDKNLRKYYKTPNDYINAWYKPYLSPSYYFPIKWQTLNGCYAFSVRNILKYKHNIWIFIPKIENYIWKNKSSLWTYSTMSQFDKYAHIQKSMYYNIDTLFTSLQAWEPVAISYMMKYYSYKEKKYKFVPHIVAAYSFDEKWIFVAETVTNTRKRITWDRVFNNYWGVKLNRIFKYYYSPKNTWEQNYINIEKNNNFLRWE